MEDKKIISRRRHIAKAFSWRVVATSVTILLTWMVTGNMAIGATVGVLEASSKVILYYLHERAWYRFGYGVMESEEADRPIEAEA
jgi:uncharacterized membrane protein